MFQNEFKEYVHYNKYNIIIKKNSMYQKNYFYYSFTFETYFNSNSINIDFKINQIFVSLLKMELLSPILYS